jgi:1-acyl-sn-glycerol-3-phosphate acyltransferase
MLTGYVLAIRGMGETLAISAPTVVDAARGRLTMETCDVRLDRWSRRLLEQADVTLDVRGRERIPDGETFVVMSNHRSLYDIPVLFQAFPRRLRMVAKSELFRVPVWGAAMRAAGFIEVDRKRRERAIASLKEARATLDRGVNVWIAPEGTRSRTGALGKFKLGGFMLALDTARRILPVAVRGTEGILAADGANVARGARVEVEFGDPIDPAVYGVERRDELVEKVRVTIATMVEREPSFTSGAAHRGAPATQVG